MPTKNVALEEAPTKRTKTGAARGAPRAQASAANDPVLSFADAAAWETWLAENHATSRAVQLRIAKKGRGASVTYHEALDVALAWGWIDSQRRALDDEAFLQRFSPRKAQSPWSKINCAKIEALVAAGKMKPPGLAEVARAKADGRWERAYPGPRTAVVPPDLAAALGKNARAKAFFESLDSTNRFAILHRIQSAKKPETRRDRIARFVAMCARGELIHPDRARKRAGKTAV